MKSKETQTTDQINRNRKAARKTALVLAVIALGVFSWSVYIVVYHATK